METLKIVLVVGLLSGAMAVGLAYLVALVGGSPVTGDEIARNGILGLVIGAIAVGLARRRVKS